MRRQAFHGIHSNGSIKRDMKGKRRKCHQHPGPEEYSWAFYIENANGNFCAGCRNRSCCKPGAPWKKALKKRKGTRRQERRRLQQHDPKLN